MPPRRVKESGPGIRMKRKPPGQPGARFGQNGNYLSELEAQPGGPEGRPHTTAGSKPIATTGRPQGVRPRSLNSDHAVPPNLPEIRREHPVPSPVSFSRTDSSPEVQRSGAAGILLGYESSWFNHARYDNENHMVTAGSAKYGYAPDGKRVWKAPDSNVAHEEFYFWTPGGQRLGIYKSTNPGTNAFTTASTNVYFGGRLIQAQATTMVTDQLGSNVGSGKRYYPYGAERPSATTNNIEKFTGYYRDTETGLDYADQRYHQPGMGRFTSPDPSATSAKLSDPGSWNRYSYVGGDPINRMDPSGLCSEYMGQLSDDDDEGLGILPYSGPCQFDPVSGAVITSQVEEVAVFGMADPAPTYASENDTSITQDDGATTTTV